MIKKDDQSWIRTRLADVSSEIFRTLVVKRQIRPDEAADGLVAALNSAVFETVLMRGKLAGIVKNSITTEQAFLDEKIHEAVSTSILDIEIQSLQAIHSRWIWTGWISKRRRPL